MLISALEYFTISSILALAKPTVNKYFILKKENYKSFLKSIYWKSIKEVKEMDHYLCQLCGKYLQYNDINIHHSTYAIRGFEHLPCIRNKNLLALCKSCHKLFHDNKNASQGL